MAEFALQQIIFGTGIEHRLNFNRLTKHAKNPTTMAKRKAEMLSQSPLASESKKTKHHNGESAPPKSTVMYDSDSESSDESGGGAKLDEPAFKINEEYAKRFEHNKKRAELHRCMFCCYYTLNSGLM